MGSIAGRAGNNGAILGFPFTAAGQDSLVIGVKAQPSAQVNQYPAQRIWPVGWEKFSFQLTGTGTGYSIKVYGTFDQQTALGNANEWFLLPGNAVDSSQGNWANPMLSGVENASVLNVKAPLLAIRATSDNAPGQTASGTINLMYMVVS